MHYRWMQSIIWYKKEEITFSTRLVPKYFNSNINNLQLRNIYSAVEKLTIWFSILRVHFLFCIIILLKMLKAIEDLSKFFISSTTHHLKRWCCWKVEHIFFSVDKHILCWKTDSGRYSQNLKSGLAFLRLSA